MAVDVGGVTIFCLPSDLAAAHAMLLAARSPVEAETKRADAQAAAANAQADRSLGSAGEAEEV